MEGATPDTIATLLRIPVSIVRSVQQLPDYVKLRDTPPSLDSKSVLKRIEDASSDLTLSILKKACVHASQKLVDIALGSTNANRGQFQAIESVLDRAGYGKTEKVQLDASFKLPEDKIGQIEQALARLASA